MRKKGQDDVLRLYANGESLGSLMRNTAGNLRFQYVESWITNHPFLPISQRFPVQEDAFSGLEVNAFFDNLLPDREEVRKKIAAHLAIADTSAFSLLEKIGEDCIGAIQFFHSTRPFRPSSGIEGTPLTEFEIAKLLRGLKNSPLFGLPEESDFRISLAGAQEKTALLRHEGNWLRPSGSTPSTYIFKPAIGKVGERHDLTDSVENEFLCLEFCRELGLKTPVTLLGEFEDQKALIVKRFDRDGVFFGDPSSQKVIGYHRIIQEDFCQATGTSAHLKYEPDGGPGILKILEILKESKSPQKDRRAFLKSQIIFWLLGATDGHAKNFSIQWDDDGFKMTPIYDVLSLETLVAKKQFAKQGLKLAMAVGKNRYYHLDQIMPRHWIETANLARIEPGTTEEIFSELQEKVPAAVEKIVANLSDRVSRTISDVIFDGALRRLKLLR